MEIYLNLKVSEITKFLEELDKMKINSIIPESGGRFKVDQNLINKVLIEVGVGILKRMETDMETDSDL